MGRVHGFVPEDPVDGEVLRRFEPPRPIRELVQHPTGYRGGVRPEQVLRRLLSLEHRAISDAPAPTLFVHGLDTLVVLLGDAHRPTRLLDEEGVVRIARGVTLGLKEGVEIPERTLDPLVGGHLLETHLHEYLSEFGAYLQQGMEMTAPHGLAEGAEVVLLEGRVPPTAGLEHLAGEIGRLLRASGCVIRSARYGVGFARDEGYQLPPFEGGVRGGVEDCRIIIAPPPSSSISEDDFFSFDN